MSLATNILRRPGSVNYYARLAIPKDLQVRMGSVGRPRRELWKSLGTSVASEAKRLVRPIIEEWHREFAELRLPRRMTEPELQDAVWKRYVELITADEQFRQALPTNDDLSAIWKHLEEEFGDNELDAFRILELVRDQFETEQRDRTTRFAKLKIDAARGETVLVADVLRKIIDERRLDLDKHGPEYRTLAQGIQRAELEALARSQERDSGDFTGISKDPRVQPPTTAAHARGETILELYDRFNRENKDRVSADSWKQNRKIVALFDDFVGGNVHVSAITRKNVREWKTKLFDWPVMATQTRVFKGLSFLKTIEKNATVGKPTIVPKTINRYLSSIGSFAGWLVANDFLQEDVTLGMYLDIDRDKREVFPYTDDQLNVIFSSPLFSRCAGEKREHETGGVIVRDWRYWIPLIGLYTGARLGEIAQLLTADVRQLHGVWIFHITTEGSKTKSVKTKGSQRVVPVHRKLIEMGLIEYHAGMKATGQVNLFPEIKPDARGFMSGNVSSFSAVSFVFIQFAGFTFGKSTSAYATPWNGSPGNNSSFLLGGHDTVDGVNNIQYKAEFGNGLSASIGLDDPTVFNRTSVYNLGGVTPLNVTGTAPNVYGAVRAPDVVGNIRVDQAWGLFQVSGALHEVNGSYNTLAANGTPTNLSELSGHPDAKWGGSVMAALQIKNLPTGKGDDIKIDATYARGTTKNVIATTSASPSFAIFGSGDGGAYQSVGFGATTDGIYAPGVGIQLTEAFGVRGAFNHNWSPTWSSSLFGSYSAVRYNGTATAVYCAAYRTGRVVSADFSCNPDFNVAQVGLITRWTPVRNLTFSAEVMYVRLDQSFTGSAILTPSAPKPTAVYNFKDQDTVSMNVRAQRNF